MSQLPRQKRAGHVQDASAEIYNADLVDLHSYSEGYYLTKHHHRQSEHDVVEVLEITSSASSSSFEDELTDFERLYPSNTRGNSLYIPPGRRQVNDGMMYAPDPDIYTMLTTLSFVTAAVHVACLAEGKYFTVPRNNKRAANSFFYPLDGLKNDLWDLLSVVEAWSRRIKLMEWEELRLSYHIHTLRLTEEEKVGKVYRALRRIGDMTDGYVYSFSTIADELKPVHLELKKLRFLLTCIIQEDNTLEPMKVKADIEATKQPEENVDDQDQARESEGPNGLEEDKCSTRDKAATVEGESATMKSEGNNLMNVEATWKTDNAASKGDDDVDANANVTLTNMASEMNVDDNKDIKPTSANDPALDNLAFSDPFTRPQTPRHPYTPTWKHAMRHLNTANLHVSDTDLNVFRDVLALTRDAQHALMAVVRLCNSLRDRAAEKQETWNEWTEIVDAWDARKRDADEGMMGY